MQFNYQGHSLKSGIYKIINTTNQRFYIGSCKEFKNRSKNHLRSLEMNKHTNTFLLNDFNKCGTEAFVFEVLEVVEGTKEERLAREQFYLDQFYDNQQQCYNFQRKAVSSCGWKPKDPVENSRKCKERSTAMWQRPEHVEKMKVVANSPENLARFHATCHTKESKLKVGAKLAKHWGKVISPDGNVFDITNLNRFCTENRLCKEAMAEMINGKTYQAKGWRRFDEALVGVKFSATENQRSKEFEIISPDGVLFKSRNVTEFCRNQGLQQGNINNVLLGKRKSHKGWSLPLPK